MADGDSRNLGLVGNLREVLRQINENIYTLEGRKGEVTLRDSIQVMGAVNTDSVVKTVLDYVVEDEDQFILVVASADPTLVKLPRASAKKRALTVKKVDVGAGVVTVVAQPAETIDGAQVYDLTAQYECVSLVSDGLSTWHRVYF